MTTLLASLFLWANAPVSSGLTLALTAMGVTSLIPIDVRTPNGLALDTGGRGQDAHHEAVVPQDGELRRIVMGWAQAVTS